MGGASWAALAAWRRGARLPASVVRRLPDAAGALVVLAGLYLASRPLWQVVRQDPDDPGARYVAGMQARQGLPVDGGRTYAEQTVAWLSWYVGPVALVVALVVLSLVTRSGVASVARGWMEPWVPALVVAAGSTLLTLARPGITPDHPWADRRLLVALPLVVVLVVVALHWLVVERSRRAVGGSGSRSPVPWRIRRAPGRPRHVAAPGWWRGAGVVGRRRAVCGALRPGDVVLAVGLPRRERVAAGRARHVWCPSLSLTSRVRSDEQLPQIRLSTRSRPACRERGGRLVLLAAELGGGSRGLGTSTPPSSSRSRCGRTSTSSSDGPTGTDPFPVQRLAGVRARPVVAPRGRTRVTAG